MENINCCKFDINVDTRLRILLVLTSQLTKGPVKKTVQPTVYGVTGREITFTNRT